MKNNLLNTSLLSINSGISVLYEKIKQQTNKKVISFSLYGSNKWYSLGAQKNIEEAKSIYPDFICRIYCPTNVPYLQELKNLAEAGECELVIPKFSSPPIFWRILAAADPNIDIAIFRDCDSVVNSREKAAVEEWLNSEKTLHLMHDSKGNHGHKVMAGMWGIKKNSKINIIQDLNEFFSQKKYKKIDVNDNSTGWGSGVANYFDDQDFLSHFVFKKFEDDYIEHGEELEFPNHEPLKYGGFVGDRISIFNMVTNKFKNMERKKLYVIGHLGAGDYAVCRNVIHYLINNYEEVVIAAAKQQEFYVNQNFVKKGKVKIEIITSDTNGFDLYNNSYIDTHQLIRLGMHGQNFPNIGWSEELCFRQIDAELDLNLLPEIKDSELKKNPKPDNYLSSTEEPLVTAIVTTYNRFKYVFNTIFSIKNQTYKNIEIIVVNDKSTDPKYKEFDWESIGVKIIHLNENSKEVHGFACSGGWQRNFAMEQAKGEYFAFCDDDDIWLPQKIEKQVSAVKDSKLGICSTEALLGSGVYDSKKEYPFYNRDIYLDTLIGIYKNSKYDFSKERKIPKIWNEEFWLIHNCAICSSVMIHKNLYKKHGGFIPMKNADDYQYWRRIIKNTQAIYIDEPLVYYDSAHGDGIHYSWS